MGLWGVGYIGDGRVDGVGGKVDSGGWRVDCGRSCVGVCGLEGVGTVGRLVDGDLPHHHALNFSVALRHYMRRALSLLNTDGIYLCGVCVRSPHVVRSVGQPMDAWMEHRAYEDMATREI